MAGEATPARSSQTRSRARVVAPSPWANTTSPRVDADAYTSPTLGLKRTLDDSVVASCFTSRRSASKRMATSCSPRRTRSAPGASTACVGSLRRRFPGPPFKLPR